MIEHSGTNSNPYIGPRAFRAGERIYGRGREANQLANLVIAERILLLYSPSGAGKTSLIQAALIPKLEGLNFRLLPIVRVNLDPGDNLPAGLSPNRYIYSVLLSLEEGLPPEQLCSSEQLAAMSLVEYMEHRPKPPGNNSTEMLIFDQFEEILSINPTDLEAKQEFFRQLGELLLKPNLWALFSMREDFVGALDPYTLQIPTRFSSTFRLDLLNKKAALQAIQEPVQNAGVQFDDDAAEKLVDDLRRVQLQQPGGNLQPVLGPYVEPVQLQVVCYRLWEKPRANPARISTQDLADIGEVDQSLVDQSLADYYTQTIKAAALETGITERSIREWFNSSLITEGGRRSTVLMGINSSGGLDNQTIRLLVDTHLVRGEKRGGATWFELSHDRLIAPLRSSNTVWFEANLSLLQRQADLWRQASRPESLLLRGQELSDAQIWADTSQVGLLPFENDFLKASHNQAARDLRLKRLNRGISALAVVAIILAASAFILFNQAITQRDLANFEERIARSQQLAAQSQAVLRDVPLRSFLLAVEALNVTINSGEPRQAAAEEALRGALNDPHGIPLLGHTEAIKTLGFSPDGKWLATGGDDGIVLLWELPFNPMGGPSRVLTGHTDGITSLAFSPNGEWLATGGRDGIARLWHFTDFEPEESAVSLSGHSDWITSLVFSSDGNQLVTGSIDQTLMVWDLTTPDANIDPVVLGGDLKEVKTLAISPDGKWLAAGSNDHIVRLWVLGNLKISPLVLTGHTAFIQTLAFSSDGKWLASGGQDNNILLWDMREIDTTSNPKPLVLLGHEDWVNILAFSPNSEWLASGSGDRTARLWNLHSETLPSVEILRGHESYINSLAFSPDGNWLATASGDKTSILWDLKANDPAANPGILRGHDQQVFRLAFSPDGGWLATGSGDASVRLWDMRSAFPAKSKEILWGHSESVNTLVFSPDGNWLATASGNPERESRDNSVRLWDMSNLTQPEVPLLLGSHDDWIGSMAISPDGKWLATGSGDTLVYLWNLDPAQPPGDPHILAGHQAWITTLAFSADSAWLATGSGDGTTLLWDVISGVPASPSSALIGNDEKVTSLAFSPDAKWLAIASDFSIYLWEVDHPTTNPKIFKGHEDWVTALAFSPDGRWLASGSRDNTVRLWDMDDRTSHPIILSGHIGWVTTLTFSPDGNWLATGSQDTTTRLWNVNDLSAEPSELRGHVGGITSLMFSPDNGWLATGSQDSTTRLWNMNALHTPPVVLRGHGDRINALAFSPDGRWLASASKDSTARLWLLPLKELIEQACRIVGRNLTKAEWQQYFPKQDYSLTCQQWPAGPR